MTDHVIRIAKLEEHAESVDRRLAAGDVGFAELRKDIAHLTEKVSALLTAAWWLIGVIVLGVLTTTGGVVITSLSHKATP